MLLLEGPHSLPSHPPSVVYPARLLRISGGVNRKFCLKTRFFFFHRIDSSRWYFNPSMLLKGQAKCFKIHLVPCYVLHESESSAVNRISPC